jgi:hypothetical protein
VKPSDLNSRVFSVRVPNEIAAAFDERLRQLNTDRQTVLAGAVRLFAALGSTEIRSALRPFVAQAQRNPVLHSALLDSGGMNFALLHATCPGRECPVPALRTAPAAKPAKPCPCPTPAAKSTRSAAPARRTVTKETTARYLGLAENASNVNIRGAAKAIASGSPLMGSSPEKQRAFAVYLGLPAHSGEDAIMRIIGSLLAVPTPAKK